VGPIHRFDFIPDWAAPGQVWPKIKDRLEAVPEDSLPGRIENRLEQQIEQINERLEQLRKKVEERIQQQLPQKDPAVEEAPAEDADNE
jgi:DNA-binding transcriptional MerR regulator